MYRGITLPPVLSRVFECVLLRLYDEFLSSDPLQFGSKKNNSCSHALFTSTETIKYFTKKGSMVHCSAFLYASKTFDKVLHNGLFLQELIMNEIHERDVTYHLTCLLIYHGTTTHLYSCFIFFLVSRS